jgi:adenylate cyclase
LYRWIHGMSGSSKELDRAFDLAARAVSLDAQETACHTALSYIQPWRRRYDEAEFHARKALALNPNRPYALVIIAEFLVYTGRPDEAVVLMNDAMRLDPNHPAWYWSVLGRAHFTARRPADAVAAMKHRPKLTAFSQAYLAATYAQLGEQAAMEGAAAEVLRLRPDFSVSAFFLAEPYRFASAREYLADSLRKAGLPE